MGPKKLKSVKSLSKRAVTCGECFKILERIESLRPHFVKVHDGRPAFEKGQMKLISLGGLSTKRKGE